MFKLNNKSILLILGIIILFTGCSKQSQKTINHFNSRPNDFEQIKEDVKVETKFLNNTEFNAFFKSPSFWVRNVSSKDYQAILLSIENSGTKSFLLDKNSINLKKLSSKEMFEILKANSLARGAAGTTFFTVLGAGVGYILLAFALIATIGAPLPVALAFTIPLITTGTGIYLGAKSYLNPEKQNKKLKTNLLSKSVDLEQEFILNTNERFSTMLFVRKKNFNKNFNLTLLNPKTKQTQLIFDILAPENLFCKK